METEAEAPEPERLVQDPVLMSIAELEALQETIEVLGDRGALEDLRASQEDVEAGRVSIGTT